MEQVLFKKGQILVPKPGLKLLNKVWGFHEGFSVIVLHDQKSHENVITKIHNGFLRNNDRDMHGKGVEYHISPEEWVLQYQGDQDYEFF